MWHPLVSLEQQQQSPGARYYPSTTNMDERVALSLGLYSTGTTASGSSTSSSLKRSYLSQPSTSQMSEALLCRPGPSTAITPPPTTCCWEYNHNNGSGGGAEATASYSYAYYMPQRHKQGTYQTRHTYLTRYGTEENIYEEISDVERARMRPHYYHHVDPQILVEEEVRRIQNGHRRVLGELNLSVEAMLMPSSETSSNSSSSSSNNSETETDDQLTDLLTTVGPTDDLLSPTATIVGGNSTATTTVTTTTSTILDLDSGFSGSSSGASYAGSLRRNLPKTTDGASTGSNHKKNSVVVTLNNEEKRKEVKKFWGKKTWKRLTTAFPSNLSLNSTSIINSTKQKAGDETRLRGGGNGGGGGGNNGTWEEVVNSSSTTSSLNRRNRNSEDSWCCTNSDSDFSTSSSDDEDDEEEDCCTIEPLPTLTNHGGGGGGGGGTWACAANRLQQNGQLRSTLNKAKTLCDKLRNGGGGKTPPSPPAPHTLVPSEEVPSRLSRWFSMRRGSTHQYDVDGATNHNSTAVPPPTTINHINNNNNINVNTKMPLLVEEPPLLAATVPDADTLLSCTPQQRRHMPPTLPPPPPDLSPAQLKRRMIVAAIVHSENSYVATLQRLVNEYKKPLEDSSPAILSAQKITTLFHRLPEILQCHTLFRIALAESVRNWDEDERIGDVFVASFSKAIVLDIYSGFINNFSVAMDLAKMEAKRKSALADFFKVKQIGSHDRLSFFGLMVKPVQRFPQFILFLQDLLKHTPQGHHDRMSLQLALTQLESLAEMLNERKRESEQYQAFKEMLRHIGGGGKFTARPLSDTNANRYLLREDNVTQLDYNQSGQLAKAKNRRLLLLNDLVVCLSVSYPKTSSVRDTNNTEVDSSNTSNIHHHMHHHQERLHLKWTHPVCDVEIVDNCASPTLSRILTAGMSISRGGSLKSTTSSSTNTSSSSTAHDNQLQQQQPTTLCTEMSSLMHDYEILSRICDLVGQLRGNYDENLSVERIRHHLQHIQMSIQQKDEEIQWADSCCLQLILHSAKGKDELLTFRTDSATVQKEWLTELRLAQLALDTNNSPAWEVPEQEKRPSTKMPLFVRAQNVYKSQHQSEVRCGCYYTLSNAAKTPRRRLKHYHSYLWICTTDGASTHITILAQNPQQASVLKDLCAFSLVETQVTAIEFVKGAFQMLDTVWMGTDSHRLLLFNADIPEKQQELANAQVPDTITCIKYHCDNVFVALTNGTLHIYHRHPIDGNWLLKEPQVIQLTTTMDNDPVSSLLPINFCVYAACGKRVYVLNAVSGELQKNFSIQHEHVGNVNLMAHSGIGLWISLKHSSTICLYHTETFKHLQDINIASNVMRVTTNTSRDCVNTNRSQVNVTSLLACKGLLWVGTNVGITLTIPLPRLEGVPIISGRVNISYHAHFGPITFLLALQSPPKPPTATNDIINTNNTNGNSKIPERQQRQFNSPVMVRRRRRSSTEMRISKTLPRGCSVFSTSSTSSADTCDVYGLYGQLMYIKDYETDDLTTHDGATMYDTTVSSLRRNNSDPELAAITNKVTTLDRKLRLKVSRPRSLDLSNWSVDSRTSSICTCISSSDESCPSCSRTVSRNNSDATSKPSPTTIVDNENQLSIQQQQQKPNNNNNNSNNKTTGDSSNGRRTVITLMGGRGYVNFRQPCCLSDTNLNKTTTNNNNNNNNSSSSNNNNNNSNKNVFSIRESNRNDAHIVIWELKL